MDEEQFMPLWFGGRYPGGALGYAYREPVWQATAHNPDYYIRAHERLSQAVALTPLPSLLPDRDAVVEIGPGTADVVAETTIPLLALLPKLDCYEAIDILSAHAEGAAATVQARFPGIITGFAVRDAFEGRIGGHGEKPLFLSMGLTIANLPWTGGTPGFVPWMARLFQDHRSARLLTSFDNCLDAHLLERAYAHQTIGHSFRAYLARTLGHAGFDPELFATSCVWDTGASQITFILEAKAEVRLRFAENDLVLPAGWRHAIGVSIRLSDADFRHYVEAAGARVVQSFRHTASHVGVYLIAAA